MEKISNPGGTSSNCKHPNKHPGKALKLKEQPLEK